MAVGTRAQNVREPLASHSTAPLYSCLFSDAPQILPTHLSWSLGGSASY